MFAVNGRVQSSPLVLDYEARVGGLSIIVFAAAEGPPGPSARAGPAARGTLQLARSSGLLESSFPPCGMWSPTMLLS